MILHYKSHIEGDDFLVYLTIDSLIVIFSEIDRASSQASQKQQKCSVTKEMLAHWEAFDK